MNSEKLREELRELCEDDTYKACLTCSRVNGYPTVFSKLVLVCPNCHSKLLNWKGINKALNSEHPAAETLAGLGGFTFPESRIS